MALRSLLVLAVVPLAAGFPTYVGRVSAFPYIPPLGRTQALNPYSIQGTYNLLQPRLLQWQRGEVTNPWWRRLSGSGSSLYSYPSSILYANSVLNTRPYRAMYVNNAVPYRTNMLYPRSIINGGFRSRKLYKAGTKLGPRHRPSVYQIKDYTLVMPAKPSHMMHKRRKLATKFRSVSKAKSFDRILAATSYRFRPG